MLFAEKNIALAVPFDTAHAYIAEPCNLPQWTNAFASASADGAATLVTAQGGVDIRLETLADANTGVVDWKMEFPDGSIGMAHSRVVALGQDACAYSFLLTPPPVPLEELEGALDQQAGILEQELQKLKALLESGRTAG